MLIQDMKIAIIGGGGVRTPLILQAMIRRQNKIQISEVALMDTNGARLALMSAVIDAEASQMGRQPPLPFRLVQTTAAQDALQGADYVITTFRVGGIESRLVDEQVPLKYGLLGQETIGPGGFAMGMRSLPVLLDYISLMKKYCPEAWLINFGNPAGMLAEGALRHGGWQRTVGICDAPAGMVRILAAVLNAPVDQVQLDYFGLNHLGWVRSISWDKRDHLPFILQCIQQYGALPGLPFEAGLLASLRLIPNEYLLYYYQGIEVVERLLRAGDGRAAGINALNSALFAELSKLVNENNQVLLLKVYYDYLHERGRTYMCDESGSDPHDLRRFEPQLAHRLGLAMGGEGYAGVALDLIEGLSGGWPHIMYLNVPNVGAVAGMDDDDVVEVPCFVARDTISPLAVGKIPSHCLGLMKQVKAYERLTIEAAVSKSYSLALQALTIHPLVRDFSSAKKVLNDYMVEHKSVFPALRC
jgi:alpha-galactosidase/6-phospho-beta-glucosidase family protein